MSAPPDWRPARLTRIETLSPDIRAFDISPESETPPAVPGAHLKIAVQIDGRPETRSYSIFETNGAVYRIAVKRLPESRGGSAYMHDLSEGARLSISGPANHFALRLGAPAYLLVAGGIGITAILSHARALAPLSAPLRVVYGAQHRAGLVFADTLGAMLGGRFESFCDGDRIDLEKEIAALAPEGEAYVCGPVPMLEAAKHIWRAAGRPMELLRIETFGGSGRWPTAPFKVRIPRLGREIHVPANQTLLQALEQAGVAMIYDCRKGECGLCALPILGVDGVVDHRDVFFSEEEKAAGEALCTCVSRLYGASITLDTADR